MLDVKLIRDARITASSTADKLHLALEMTGAGFERIRVLLSLAEAKDLFCHVDLAVTDMETAKKSVCRS